MLESKMDNVERVVFFECIGVVCVEVEEVKEESAC